MLKPYSVTNLAEIAPREPVQSLYLQRQVLDATPGGWSADVEWESRVYSVSQLDGENDWTIDGAFTTTGLPIFFNGTGARYTLLHKISEPVLVDALDEAVAMRKAGVDGSLVG